MAIMTFPTPNKNPKSLFRLVIALVSTLFCAESSAVTLTIEISNAPVAEGFLMVAVCQDEEQFNTRKCSITRKMEARERTNLVDFENITAGKYAVIVFHDINANGHLDKNILGMPKEPIGFSQNPKLMFGPPNYNDTTFSLGQSNLHILIRLLN